MKARTFQTPGVAASFSTFPARVASLTILVNSAVNSQIFPTTFCQFVHIFKSNLVDFVV